MPYKSNADLPSQLKGLPERGQTIFRKAFNASFSKHGEERARKIAWSAVKKVFEKKEDKWVLKKKTQSFVKLYVEKIQSFTQNEILSLIPNETLSEIKSKDAHPYFQMYSICHEGVSNPTVLGEGPKSITWTRRAVQSIKNVITKGINFFKGHNDDNSTDNRKSLGKVIHSFEKEIDGKLHHIAIAYHPPEVRDEVKKYDICSQESTWNFIESAGNLIADTIDKLTGIALGNSQTERPAFSEAKRLGFVQAFEKTGDVNMSDEITTKPLTFDQLKQACKDLNVFPRQLFDENQLKEDREFGKLFVELEDLRKQKENFDKKVEELNNQNKELVRVGQLSNAKTRLENIYKETGLTEKMKEFVNKTFEERKESLQDISDEGLKNFVENQSKVFQNVASFIDPQIDLQIPNGDEKANKSNDYSKAKNNPFIVEDLEED